MCVPALSGSEDYPESVGYSMRWSRRYPERISVRSGQVERRRHSPVARQIVQRRPIDIGYQDGTWQFRVVSSSGGACLQRSIIGAGQRSGHEARLLGRGL